MSDRETLLELATQALNIRYGAGGAQRGPEARQKLQEAFDLIAVLEADRNPASQVLTAAARSRILNRLRTILSPYRPDQSQD